MNQPPPPAIWFIDLDAFGFYLDRIADAKTLLPKAELTRLAAINNDANRHQSKITQATLRLALSDFVSADIARSAFDRAPGGKPTLSGNAAHFSIAHTRNAALIAITSDTPVGIDLESRRDVAVGADRHAAYVSASITLANGARLPGTSDDDDFVTAWTRVEATAKATGLGIGGLINAIDLRRAATDHLDATRLDTTLGTGLNRLVARDLKLPDPYFAAIAIATSAPHIQPVTVDAMTIKRWSDRFST
jgi:phosphopantetheinyl transferase